MGNNINGNRCKKTIPSKIKKICVKMFIGILLSVALCGVHGQEAAGGLGELSRILQADDGSKFLDLFQDLADHLNASKTENDRLKKKVSRLEKNQATVTKTANSAKSSVSGLTSRVSSL